MALARRFNVNPLQNMHLTVDDTVDNLGKAVLGITYGESDEYGIDVARDKVHFHDFHATILHLMGMDHKRLTYRHAGRDFRLTDVHGEVVDKILA